MDGFWVTCLGEPFHRAKLLQAIILVIESCADPCQHILREGMKRGCKYVSMGH